MKRTGNIALIICAGIISYLVIERTFLPASKKIGVVQMDKLVYEYKGMKEASSLYSKKVDEWSEQADSLQSRLNKMYEQIRLDSIQKDQAKLDRDIKTFLVFKKSYLEYIENVKQSASEKDKEMTLGVVNQLNEYIKTYANENGYDVILCNSSQQSIGHVREQIDVTAKVLEFANKKYEGF